MESAGEKYEKRKGKGVSERHGRTNETACKSNERKHKAINIKKERLRREEEKRRKRRMIKGWGRINKEGERDRETARRH